MAGVTYRLDEHVAVKYVCEVTKDRSSSTVY